MVCEIGIAVQSTRGSQLYDGKQNWGKGQPTRHDSVEAYIEDAFARRDAFRHIIEDFAKAAGPGIIVIAPSVKTQSSAERKLWDRTSSTVGQPDMIGDYLRARLLVPVSGNLNQLNDAIDKLIDHPLTIGFKDRIFRPNGAAFRAVNYNMEVDGLSAELQIIPDDREHKTRMANSITEGLRLSERALRDAEEKMDAICAPSGRQSESRAMNKMVTRAEIQISNVRDFRKALHDFAADHAGVNVLMDPKLVHKHAPPSPEEISSLFKAMSKNYFGKNIASRLQAPIKSLLSDQPCSMPLHLQ